MCDRNPASDAIHGSSFDRIST
jgi:hypothetical protein